VSAALYVDSSFLLAIILRESGKNGYVEEWERAQFRGSSILLEAEGLATLRRAFRGASSKLPSDWLEKKQAELGKLLEEVSLRTVDAAIIQSIRNKQELSGCRTLDALHLATALEFRKSSDDPITVCTLDREMRKLSKKLEFAAFPDDVEQEI